MRISVTTMESFRQMYECEELPNGQLMINKEDFINRLKKGFFPNEKMKIGTSLHNILENLPKELALIKNEEYYDAGDYKFAKSFVDEMLSHSEPWSIGIKESKKVFPIEINGEKINIVGKIDRLAEFTGYDYKATFTTINPERYLSSCQGKYYMMMWNLKEFYYIVGKVSIVKSGLNFFNVMKVNASKRDDVYCLNLLENFVFFIKENSLEQYFKDK